MLTADVLCRVADRITFSDECWLWSSVNAEGYGTWRWPDGRQQKAHRTVWELFVSELDAGNDLDHLCRNRRCVNPDHLEPVTRQENLRRGRHFHREQTHCKRGHAFDEANTYVCADGHRRCRACDRQREA